MSHRKYKKRKKRNTEKRISLAKIIWCAMIAAVIIAVFLFIRNIYLFSIESNIDPDDPYPVIGVDVSVYQGDIDWRNLKNEGVRFAFIKATEGTSLIDRNFKYNWRKAHRTGIKTGAYHFMSYDSPGDVQAQHFIKTVGNKWGMMPPVVDVEFYDEYLTNNPSKDKMYSVLDAFLEEVEKEYRVKPIIYTNLSIYNKYISGRYDGYPIWISSPDSILDKLPDGRSWLFCQHTFTGTSPSIEGGNVYVDYNVFNGSKWEFRKYDGK